MRISGGTIKGRNISVKKAFAKGGLRPTSSKVRQAIFNILQDKIRGSSFLDLFAGTGAVGIEALSRGSDRVIFVDANEVRIDIIKKIILDLGFSDKASVKREDAMRFLRTSNETFDIIFADPPYGFEDYGLIAAIVSERDILRSGGILIIEHSSKKRIEDVYEHLNLLKTYKYGDTSLTVYRKEKL
jgi:16S rRNA (guanine(966)-N(2))-methyltransferase RsmD